MSALPIIGGFYKARSIVAACQRSVNQFPEVNPKGAAVPMTSYPRSGLKRLTNAGAAAGRSLYRATNGQLFAVIGFEVYYVDAAFALHFLGNITAGATQVSMADNGLVILIVDGTANGYTVDLTTHAYATIADAAFYGSTRAEYMDTYFILNRPGTTQWYISPPNWDGIVPFDALDIADKLGGADNLVCAAVNAGNIQTIGLLTSQIWYNSGGTDFPFGPVPSVLIEHGTPAPYSVVQNDVGTYLLSQDDDGGCIFGKIVGYEFQRFSTHAIEHAISQYADVTDCIGMTYQQEGHAFVRFTFPSANATWVWDEASKFWHEQTWTDNDGQENRHRANATAYAYGKNLALDWETGIIYQEDTATFVDELLAGTSPIVYRRGFPHILNDGKRVSYAKFIANMEVGMADGLLTSTEPMLSLRWSDTRGASWSDPITTGFGATGQYERWPTFWQLGMGQDRVFELFWSAPYRTALNGAFVETVAART